MFKKFLKNANTIISSFPNLLFSPKIEYICKNERFGTSYGGYNVVIESITSNSIIYSFGIGEDASFDNELIHRFNVIVHAFDPIPKSIQWVKKQKFSEKFIFHNFGIANFDGLALFSPPENPEHISHTLINREGTKNAVLYNSKSGLFYRDRLELVPIQSSRPAYCSN